MSDKKYWETAEFKKLQGKWYKKLSREGFEDAEQDETFLKQFSGKVSGVTESEYMEKNGTERRGYVVWERAVGNDTRTHAKAEYYRWCRQMLNDFPFKTKKEQKIWELHSEGEGERAIAKVMKTYRRKITDVLKRLGNEMKGIKK